LWRIASRLPRELGQRSLRITNEILEVVAARLAVED